MFFCCYYRKHAFVDMASEMDLNKALALDGEEILDKPMKIAKAKVKSNDNKKVKCPQVDKEGKTISTSFFGLCCWPQTLKAFFLIEM